MIQEKIPHYFAEFTKEFKDFKKNTESKLENAESKLEKLDEIIENQNTHFEAIGEIKVQISELSESISVKKIKNLEKRTKVLEDLLLA